MEGSGQLTTVQPFAAVIVPTWNRKSDVIACVVALLQSDYEHLAIVVVDNGSVDGTADALCDRFGDSVVVLRNRENLGYAGGNNVGIRWAMERDAKYVCLVNNDAEAPPEFVSAMVAAAESAPRIGAVGCRNLELENPSRLWGAYGALTYGPFVVRMEGQGRPDTAEWQVRKDVDWVVGNGSLWSCAAIDEVGLLDEDLFAYHDDVDWSVRFRRAGYRVFYAGDVAIHHRGGGTSDPSEEHFFPLPYFLGRNGVLFVRKHARFTEKLRYAFFSIGAMLGRWVRALASRVIPFVPERDPGGRRYWDWEVSYARGVLDGVRGRSPEPGLTNSNRSDVA